MFRRKLAAGLAIILALAGVSHASAQETATEPVVIGRVVDAEGGDPVAGVRVHLEQSGLSWITASDGRFRFVVPAPGTDRLTLSGHEITTRSLDVSISPHGVTDLGDLTVSVTIM